MIAYLKGEVMEKTEDNLVLEVNQVGMNVKISTGMANLLPPVGSSLKIYTYTYVREDAFHLYGFLTKDDLEIFKKLITVSGIGPKGALAILSVMSADSLRFAIMAGDAKAISKAPGVGTKTAERVILDLRDKISVEDTLFHKEASGLGTEQGGARSEAAEALVALGYSAGDALKVINGMNGTEDMDAEAILKLALKKMAFL